MDPYGVYGPDLVLISIHSRHKVFEFDPILIEDYLPGLWELMMDGALPQHSDGTLRPEDLGIFGDPTSQRALSYLFDYLEDVLQHGVSAALDNSLENLWKACKGRPREHHPGMHPGGITAVFGQLGKIFAEENFGSNDTIFHIMSTFFIRHCAEIVRWGRKTWIDYLFALDRMDTSSESLVPALNCVIQQQRLHPGDFRELAYHPTPRGHKLRPDTLELLEHLSQQKHEQDHHRHERGSEIWVPRRLEHRGDEHRHDVVRRRGRGEVIRRGIDYDPRTLKKIAAHNPEAILVDEGLRGRSHRRMRYIEDNYSDSEPEPEYVLQYGREHLPRHMRRARRDHMIEDVRRPRSMSMEGFEGLPFEFMKHGRGVGGWRPEMVGRGFPV